MDQVITKYYRDLVTLPFDDVYFRSRLETAGLFEGNLKEEVKAKPTSAEKAEHFLDKIKNDHGRFIKLLTVMEEFSSNSKNLASKIKSDIQQHFGELGNSLLSI